MSDRRDASEPTREEIKRTRELARRAGLLALALLEAMTIKHDKKTNRYKGVSSKQVRASIDSIVEIVREDLRVIGKSLATGAITLAAWQSLVKERITTAQKLAAAIGRGGRRQMTNADWGNSAKGNRQTIRIFGQTAPRHRNGTRRRIAD